MAYGDKMTHKGWEYWMGDGAFYRRAAGSKESYHRINIGEVPDEVRRQLESGTELVRRRA